MKLRSLAVLVFATLFITSISFAQKKSKKVVQATSITASNNKLDMALFKDLKFRSIGPGTMSGRVTSIDAVWANPDIIYVGTASGGVWKTENGGTTWESIFDKNPIINIGAVAIQQSNPAVIWAGTGEGNPRNSINLGAGIFKSMDGGKTWKSMGLEKTVIIHRILIDPNNPNVVYVGATGNPFASHQERGVYKTTNGGETWERILFTNENSGVGDFVMDPTNPNKLLVNMWEHKRTPYDFKSGGAGSGMYLTYDGGKNWKKLTDKNGLPKGDLGRMGFAIAPSDPNIIYALVESDKNALYKSFDGGEKWEKITDDEDIANNRPFYFFDLAVDPQNENRVYNIYQMISLSEDGGKNFKVIVPYSGVHPDHHAFWIHPQDPSFIINGNDGGVAISRDRAKKWQYCESIPVGQFYHINVDNEIPYNVYGGLQDNGSWKGPSYTWKTGGIRNQYWEVVLFGDGFDVVPDPSDNRYGWAMSQGGNLARYDVLTGASEFLKPTHPDPKMRLRFNWNAAIAHDKGTGALYFGSQFIHKSMDKGYTWEIISPDLTTNNKEQIKASDNSGGLTMDITSAENHNSILTIAPSTLDKNVIWVGTDDGNVQVTRDGGKTWQEVSSKMAGLPDEAWIPQIRASTYNAGEAFVVANNYRNGGAFIPYVYRTKNYGLSWERMVDESKVTGYALSVIQDPVEPNLIFVGTEQGLFMSLDNGISFNRYEHGFPPASSMDLAIQERESDLVVATFGRGIYVLDNIKPLRDFAKNNALKNTKLKVFAANDAYLAEIKDAPGIMFGGDGMYEGDNRRTGSLIRYYAAPKGNKNPKDSTTFTYTDSLIAKIYDATGLHIRTLKQKVDTVGFHTLYWGLNEKGNRYPGSKKPKPSDSENGGMDVLPGIYKVVVKMDSTSDSTMVTVKADPRKSFDLVGETKKREIVKRLYKSTDKLVQATDRLEESKITVENLIAQLKTSEDKGLDTLMKASKAMLDSLKSTNEIVMGKKFKRQGYGRPFQITAPGEISEASRYVRSKSKIGAAEMLLVENAEAETEKTIEKVNAFYETQWASYRKLIESMKVPVFKDYEKIE
ncbi:Uncharacterized protein SAMN06298216_0367 [Spirosomataceae bacterium TFI 002]|nr:Uncharacterized protein SAMN06298216_0367 [Spirosomataceae bacterium TFI 002]